MHYTLCADQGGDGVATENAEGPGGFLKAESGRAMGNGGLADSELTMEVTGAQGGPELSGFKKGL